MNSKEFPVESENILFQPWVGSNYNESIFGIPILIVGESNYAYPKDLEHLKPHDTFTHRLIESIIDGSWKHNFFSNIQRTFVEKPYDPVSRKEFWSSVAHCEYIQDWLLRPGISPTEDMWKKAAPIFKDVVEQLNPKCILFTGKGVFHRASAGLSISNLAVDEIFAPTYQNPHSSVKINGALASWVYHPAAFGGLGHYKRARVVANALVKAVGGTPLI